MKIKNIAAGGRGFGVVGAEGAMTVEFAAGETKDVDNDIIARAKKDPTNAGMFADGGCFVEVTAKAAPKAEPAPSDTDPQTPASDDGKTKGPKK